MPPEPLPHGEFEITNESQDVFRALYAQMGLALPYMALLWTAALWSAISSLAAGEQLFGFSGFMAAMGSFVIATLGISALRAPKAPPWTIRITDQSIAASRPSGEVKLNWAALTRIEERAGMLLLFAGRMIISLPLYRMSEVQVASVRARLSANPISKAAQQSKKGRRLLLWVLLILMFVAVYNLFGSPSP
jgi:hypothetical protein